MTGKINGEQNAALIPETGLSRVSPWKCLIYIVLSLWSLTTIYPMFWLINNSFKPSGDVISRSFGLAGSFDLINYNIAVERINILKAYYNSLIISGSVVLLVMILAGLSAYVMARYKFPLKSVIYTALVGSILFPVFSTVVPVFTMLSKMGVVSTHLGLILPQTAGNLPFAILILSAYMATIPVTLEEASYMDGCSMWQRFAKIIVPIARPSFATVGIFTFLWSYNDLFMSLVILRKRESYPICVLLSQISSIYGTDFGLMAAAVTMTVVPVMIIYLLAQNQIIKGLTAGAIKE